LVGLLLQAAAVVRHNISVLQVEPLDTTINAPGVVCRADGAKSVLPASGSTGIPDPGRNSGDCPICMGLVGVVAVLAAAAPVGGQPLKAAAPAAVVDLVLAERSAGMPPPARGPPTRS
jgi:hypothetical protein